MKKLSLLVALVIITLNGNVHASDNWEIKLNVTPESGNAPLTVSVQTTIEETDVCDSSHLNLCTNSDVCSMADGYWWSDSSCNDTPECDSNNFALCTSSIGCTDAGGDWISIWGSGYCRSAEESSSKSTISLEIIDTKNAVIGDSPLLDNPYDGVGFLADGAYHVLRDDSIADAITYTEMLIGFHKAIANSNLSRKITANLGNSFSTTDPSSGLTVNGTEILLTSDIYELTLDNRSGWIAGGMVPADSSLHTNMSKKVYSTPELDSLM